MALGVGAAIAALGVGALGGYFLRGAIKDNNKGATKKIGKHCGTCN